MNGLIWSLKVFRAVAWAAARSVSPSPDPNAEPTHNTRLLVRRLMPRSFIGNSTEEVLLLFQPALIRRPGNSADPARFGRLRAKDRVERRGGGHAEREWS